MSHRGSSDHPDGFDLDCFAVDERADVSGHVRAHVVWCRQCRARIEAFRLFSAEFDRIADRMLDDLRARLARYAWSRRVSQLLAVAAGVALASAAMLRARETIHPPVAIKGHPVFALYVQRAGQALPFLSGAPISPGEAVRFVLRPAGFHYVLIVSVDAAAHASVYFPYDGATSGTIDDADEVTLPGSIVLDATPGPERMYALFSERPVSAEAVRPPLLEIGRLGPDAIRRRERLAVEVAAQSSVLLENTGAVTP